MGASLPPRTGVDKKHRIWITTLKLAQMTHTHHPDPDCLTIMWKQKTYLLYQSSLNDQGNAGLNAKLTATFTLISPWAARGSAITLLSGSYQGKALDCIVIIRQLYLPAVASLLSIHMYNSLPSVGPAFEKRAKCWELKLDSPTEWITEPRTETCSCILLLSQTADRLTQWVWWLVANLASLILWDELSHPFQNLEERKNLISLCKGKAAVPQKEHKMSLWRLLHT